MAASKTKTAEQFHRRTGITADDRAVLGQLPLFAGLSDDALRQLLVDAWVQSFPRNAMLFLQGDPAVRFYVVFDGWVKLYRATEQGDESVIGVFAGGESFAEAALFDSAVYPVSAAVVEDSRLLVVPADRFIGQLAAHGEYAIKMMAAMARHMHQLVRQVEQLTLKSSTERVAGFLLKLCPYQDGAAVIRLPLDKALIAGRLGMQPETLSRSFAKLRPFGVVSKGPEISIADVAALRRMSNGRQSTAGR